MATQTTQLDKKRKRSVRPIRETQDGSSKMLNKLSEGVKHHAVKEARKAAKKAKAFELRRLVKKLKDTRKKEPSSEDLPDLESQLEILKKCNHESYGTTALKAKLKKDHVLSQNEDIISAIAKAPFTDTIPPGTPGSAIAKVQARLLSSKALASEVASMITSLRAVLQPELGIQHEEHDEESDEQERMPPTKIAKTAKTLHRERDSAESTASESEDVSDAASDHSPLAVDLSDNEDEVDDGGWESGSIHSEESGSDDHEQDEEPSTSKLTLKPNPAKTLSKHSAESTFLPSLSVGFTRGNSDASDISEDEGDVAPKKNRRGQRARRAIWEKKYGRNANHVKNGRETEMKSDRRRPGERGAHSKSQVAPRPHQARPEQARVQANLAPSNAAPPKDKPLHPSWEAKKRLKQMQNPTIVAPQGTKIVFD